MAGRGSEPRRSVISKVVAIIRSFGSGGALTITEIAHAADLPLSTTHRLVHELAAWGVVHRGHDARYEMVLPPRPCGCGECLLDLRMVAAPVIEDLSAVTRSDVRLAVLEGLRVLYVEKVHGGQPMSAFSDAATLPAHATALGKVLLAFSPPETVVHLVRHGLRCHTAATVATARGLRHALKVTRLRGMAVARGELFPDYCAVAVPVFGPTGEVVAALEVRFRDLVDELPVVVPALTIAARGLSRDLGRPAHPPAAAAVLSPIEGSRGSRAGSTAASGPATELSGPGHPALRAETASGTGTIGRRRRRGRTSPSALAGPR